MVTWIHRSWEQLTKSGAQGDLARGPGQKVAQSMRVQRASIVSNMPIARGSADYFLLTYIFIYISVRLRIGLLGTAPPLPWYLDLYISKYCRRGMKSCGAYDYAWGIRTCFWNTNMFPEYEQHADHRSSWRAMRCVLDDTGCEGLR